MLLNYAEDDLFNSHISHSSKGIHQKYLICIPHSGWAEFASLSHQTMFYSPNHIMLFRCTFSSPNTFWKLHCWTTDESSHHPLIEHSSGKKPDLKSRAWRSTNADNSEMTQDRDNGRQGIDAILNGNNQYHITFRKKGSWEETPMHNLIQSAIEVYVNPVLKAIEGL